MDKLVNHGAKMAKPPLVKVFVIEGLLLLVISVVLYGLTDTTTASSAFIGGLIYIAPQAYFARWAFRFSGARSADLVARGFYLGESGKFILTAIMFAGVFALIRPIDNTIIFVTYLAMVALNWFLLARLK